MDTFFGSSATFSNPDFTIPRFESLIATLIIKRDLPFSFVDWEETEELVTYLKPGVKIMSRRALVNRMTVYYAHMSHQIKTKMVNIQSS